MMDVYTEEEVLPKQVSFVLLFFAVVFIVMGYPNKKVEGKNFLSLKETAYEIFRSYFNKK